MPSLLHSWVFDRDGVDFGAVVRASQDGELGPPALQLSLLSSTGDTITVQVMEEIILPIAARAPRLRPIGSSRPVCARFPVP